MSLHTTSNALSGRGIRNRVVIASKDTRAFHAKAFLATVAGDLAGADALKHCLRTRTTAHQSAVQVIEDTFKAALKSPYHAEASDYKLSVSVGKDLDSADVVLELVAPELGSGAFRYAIAISGDGVIQSVKQVKASAVATATSPECKVQVSVTGTDPYTRSQVLLKALEAYDEHREQGVSYKQVSDPEDAVFVIDAWSDKPADSVHAVLERFFKSVLRNTHAVADLLTKGLRTGKIVFDLPVRSSELAFAGVATASSVSVPALSKWKMRHNGYDYIYDFVVGDARDPALAGKPYTVQIKARNTGFVVTVYIAAHLGGTPTTKLLNRLGNLEKPSIEAFKKDEKLYVYESAEAARKQVVKFCKQNPSFFAGASKVSDDSAKSRRRGNVAVAADDFKIVCKTKLPAADMGILDQRENGALRTRGAYEDITTTKLVNSYKKAIRNTITPVKHLFNGITSLQAPGHQVVLLVRKFGNKAGEPDITNIRYEVTLLNAEHKPVYRVEDITPIMELKLTEIRSKNAEANASVSVHRPRKAHAGADVADVRRVSNNKLVRSVRDEISNDKLNDHAGDFIKELVRIASEEQLRSGEACYIYWRGTKYFPDFKTHTLKNAGSAQRRFANSY